MTDTTPTPAQVLATPMQANDADAPTIGDYLVKLLAGVWEEQEGFNGKRPFGNSGWDYELIGALVHAGLIEGVTDSDGYIESADDAAGKQIITDAIRGLSAAWAGGQR